MIDPRGILEEFASSAHGIHDVEAWTLTTRPDKLGEYTRANDNERRELAAKKRSTRHADIDAHRASQRDYYARVMADPERAEAERAKKRAKNKRRKSRAKITAPAAEGRADHIDGGGTAEVGATTGIVTPRCGDGRLRSGQAELSALHANCTHEPRDSHFAPLAKAHGTDEPRQDDTWGEHAAAVR